MEEFNKFLRFLRRNILIVIVIPIATVIITFFLVRNIPDSYVSQGEIATGIVDETKRTSLDEATPQAQQIVQEFENLMALMKMNKVLDQISYQLLIHDLSTDTPFRPLSKSVANLSNEQKQVVVDSLKLFYYSNTTIDLSNKNQKYVAELIASMKYDSESLKDRIQVFRSGVSDFLIVRADTEDPLLSAFIVNKLSSEFIKYYSGVVKANQTKTTAFLRDLLAQKSDTLIKKTNVLRDYKVQNRVLNLDEQSSQLYSQIMKYDNQKQEAIQKTSSYAGALNEIDKKFNPSERKYIESKLSGVNQDIISIKDEISELYDLYYKSDLDARYKQSIDSLDKILAKQINRSSDAYITNPLNTKQALITEKLNLGIQLDISRYSINSLEKELKRLNGQFDELVPREADVQKLERNVDIASKEYIDILSKYNQSSLETSFEVKLSVVQSAAEGLPQPSKKMLLVILSGVITLLICLLIIFIIYYLDNSITDAKELANATQIPVLGELRKLSNSSGDLSAMWTNKENLAANVEFKHELRSIRYEIEKEINDKLIIITSIDPSEGKTLLSLSLGFAWKMTNHKVLLIDGNFANGELTKSAVNPIFLEDYIEGKSEINLNLIKEGSVFILGNKGGDTSLLELSSQEHIEDKINSLKKIFDVILVETSALDGMNQAKEWMSFANGVIAVFKSGSTLTENKKSFITYLKENTPFKGWIINKVMHKYN